MIIYSNDFSTDPNWSTDQTENFYWDSATGTFVAKTENEVPDYSPNRYAFEDINLDVSQSFSISWDQQILERDGYAMSHFGLFADDLITNSVTYRFIPNIIPESTLNAGLGGFAGGTEYYNFNIYTGAPNGDGVGGSGGTRGGEVGTWFSHTLSYDAEASEVTWEMSYRDTGDFSEEMTNLAVANNPIGYHPSLVWALDPTDYQITTYDNIVVIGEPLMASGVIDFGPTFGAPSSEVQLTNQLADFGVIFSSPSPDGVLWFGDDPTISSYSYVFNAGWDGPYGSVAPITIDFVDPDTGLNATVSEFSVRAFDGGGDNDILTITGYDADGAVVTSATLGPSPFRSPGQTISISGSDIDYVVLETSGTFSGLFFDDVSFTIDGVISEEPTPVSTGFALPIGNREGEGVLATEDRYDADGWWVAGDFGDPYTNESGVTSYHLGEDWNYTNSDGVNDVSDDFGAAVFAASNGKVVYAGPHYGPAKNFDTAYGNLVVIEHLLPDGRTVYSLYAHLNSIEAGIEPDAIVDGTDVQIGELGQTGFSPTPHLHFEIFEGNWQLAVAEIAYVGSPIPDASSHEVTYPAGQYSWQTVVDGEVVSTLVDHGEESITWYDPADLILGVGDFSDETPITEDGGKGGNTVEGGNGNDVLDGGVGDDFILGGYGNDQLNGDRGADVISGGGGSDIIFGGQGEDAIQGGADNDLISGGSGADILEGGAGSDQIDGGAGADRIDGGFGSDQIDGAQGDDIIIGGADSDILVGGRGSDQFIFATAFEYDAQDDRILDFGSNDLIVFASEVTDFSELTISQSGSDTVIEYGAESSITLVGFNSADLSADYFLFA